MTVFKIKIAIYTFAIVQPTVLMLFSAEEEGGQRWRGGAQHTSGRGGEEREEKEEERQEDERGGGGASAGRGRATAGGSRGQYGKVLPECPAGGRIALQSHNAPIPPHPIVLTLCN